MGVGDDSRRAFPLSADQGWLEIGEPGNREERNGDTERPAGRLQLESVLGDRVGWVGNHGESRRRWQHLLQQLDVLLAESGNEIRQASHVATRLGQAADESLTHRIHHEGHDDGDRCRNLHGGPGLPGAGRDDDVHLRPDQLGHEARQARGVTAAEGVADDEVLALDVPEFAHRIAERLPVGGPGRIRPERQQRNRRDLRARLRPRGDGRGKETAGQRADERAPIQSNLRSDRGEDGTSVRPDSETNLYQGEAKELAALLLHRYVVPAWGSTIGNTWAGSSSARRRMGTGNPSSPDAVQAYDHPLP